MNARLYVGNLSYDIDEEGLKEAFEAFGAVTSVRIILDRYSGKSRGFGFIEMENAEAAQKAMEELDGKELLGRELKISEAKEPQKRDNGRRNNGGNRGPRRNDDNMNR